MPRKIKVINAETGKLIEVDADAIKQGPIRNRSLSDPLLRRIRAIHASIKEVYDVNLEQFEVTFMRDSNPQREVAVWERIAVAFTKAKAALPTVDPKMILKTLLAYSMGALTPEEEADPMVKKIIKMAEGR